MADHEGRDIDNRFNVHAPYFRVGMDYNINKNTRGNRLFAGVRYGISAFNYDLTSPTPLTDPVWKTSQPFNYESMRATAQWAEVLFGLETRIWKMVRVGWDVRFKFRITQTTGEVGPPWFIPGYGPRKGSLGLSLGFYYTLPIRSKAKAKAIDEPNGTTTTTNQ